MDRVQQLETARNVDVCTGAHVLGLASNAAGAHVEHVDIGHRDGLRRSLRASHYVPAAGGIENARPLLLSSRANPAGSADGSDLVGRCSIEHPTVSTGLIVPDRWPGRRQGRAARRVHEACARDRDT
jgi:choline dehydrogenase-like flavoprotein